MASSQEAVSLVLLALLGLLLLGLLGSLGLLLDDLLDDLLLLDQESSHDSLLDTVGTSGATVWSGDSLVGLGHGCVLSWSQRGNTSQGDAAVTTLRSGGQLLDVLRTQDTAWGLNNLDLVGLGVVCIMLVSGSGSAPRSPAAAAAMPPRPHSCKLRGHWRQCGRTASRVSPLVRALVLKHTWVSSSESNTLSHLYLGCYTVQSMYYAPVCAEEANFNNLQIFQRGPAYRPHTGPTPAWPGARRAGGPGPAPRKKRGKQKDHHTQTYENIRTLEKQSHY